MDLTFRRTAQSPLSVRSIGSDQFWGSKFLNFNICGVFFQKDEYFWGKEEFVDVLRGHQNTGLSRYRMGIFFFFFFFWGGGGGCLYFKYFWGYA